MSHVTQSCLNYSNYSNNNYRNDNNYYNYNIQEPEELQRPQEFQQLAELEPQYANYAVTKATMSLDIIRKAYMKYRPLSVS